jgi:hypothetical protein
VSRTASKSVVPSPGLDRVSSSAAGRAHRFRSLVTARVGGRPERHPEGRRAVAQQRPRHDQRYGGDLAGLGGDPRSCRDQSSTRRDGASVRLSMPAPVGAGHRPEPCGVRPSLAVMHRGLSLAGWPMGTATLDLASGGAYGRTILHGPVAVRRHLVCDGTGVLIR